jgi:hypothetical protein
MLLYRQPRLQCLPGAQLFRVGQGMSGTTGWKLDGPVMVVMLPEHLQTDTRSSAAIEGDDSQPG